MPRYLATYDLINTAAGPHLPFTEAAISLTWSPVITDTPDGVPYDLPNTTLVGDFSSIDEARRSFLSVAPLAERTSGQRITVRRWALVQYTLSHAADDRGDRPRQGGGFGGLGASL